jgi:hypothetical protein
MIRFAPLLLLLVGACAEVPGDPDTIVLDRTPLAGYAWMGPATFSCCSDLPGDEEPHVAWQIWFTNTEDCPSRTGDFVAGLVIVSPEIAMFPPSTELPSLSKMTLMLRPGYALQEVTEPFAYLSVQNVEYATGTLALTTYSADEIRGHFEGQAHQTIGTDVVPTVGTFVARRCSRLH